MTRAAALAGRAARAALLFLIDIYRAVLSPLITAAIGPACRFEPTCAAYAREAICRHGVVLGGRLALDRLLRCRPGGGWGSDPVPTIPVRKVPVPHDHTARALT